MDLEHVPEHTEVVGSLVTSRNEEVEQPPVMEQGQPAQPERLLETMARTSEQAEAEEWFKQMEDIFDIIGIDDEMKVKLAAFRFVDRARQWWKDAKARLTTPRVGSQDIPRITWKRFEDEFNDQYFPEAYRNVKQRKFILLVQG